MTVLVLDPYVVYVLAPLADNEHQGLGGRLAAAFLAMGSKVLSVAFRLVAAKPRPKLEITHHDSQQRWLA